VSPRYSNEDARDSVGEAETVMKLADIREGMYVADIGAGEGYYTVRLAPLVGKRGRVLAQDIVPETRNALAQRIQRENIENVAVKLGEPNNPHLPDGSFDRILLIHMYHEIEVPSEFLWHVRADLKPDGRVVVVDADRPTDRHGTPPKLLICEFGAIGYQLTRFERLATANPISPSSSRRASGPNRARYLRARPEAVQSSPSSRRLRTSSPRRSGGRSAGCRDCVRCPPADGTPVGPRRLARDRRWDDCARG
jgi:ubiquinone/menaquinone biosynthesis C-methylase UbiE